MKHKTVTVELGGFKEEIDESIAPLIKKLWELKIRTVNSCENNVPEGWIWIEFANSFYAEKFLNIVAEYDKNPNNLYNRICQEWSLDDQSLFWKYEVHPMDCGVEQTVVDDEIEEKFTGKSDFIFTFSIRFPQSDLEQVMNRLTKHDN